MLRFLANRSAVRFEDRWVWKQDLREDADLAARLMRALEVGGLVMCGRARFGVVVVG